MEAFIKFVPLVILIFVGIIGKQAFATKHAVGGSQGWDESTDFDSWASSQTFKVGDELEFKYTAGLHSVVELADESAFNSCDVGTSLNSLNGGSNTVKLSKTGTRFFACGTSGHCQQGMKVKITAVAADGSAATSSSSSPAATHSATSSSASSKLRFLGFFGSICSFVVCFLI